MTLERLTAIITERCRNAPISVVALSGGVDSSLVALAAHRSLGGSALLLRLGAS